MNAGARFVMLAPILPLAVFAAIYAKPPWTITRVFGLTLFTVSFALLTWSRANLGNSFSVTPQARQLVTRGIYSKVRHPVYVFGVLCICGVALYMRMPWIFAILIVIIPTQIARARAEERVLQERFGDEYLDYKKSTWL
jgi:protein-S-isoprenylcysteine O-methyltransferase Ste14